MSEINWRGIRDRIPMPRRSQKKKTIKGDVTTWRGIRVQGVPDAKSITEEEKADEDV